MKKIALYNGPGSKMFKDLINFFEQNQVSYSTIDETQIKNGALANFEILIIGGGAIWEIMPALGEAGTQAIKHFVENGGKYIGICAGAYIACQTFFDSKNQPYQGLGLSTSQFKRGHEEKIAQMNGFKLFYCNGPLLEKLGEDEIIINQNTDSTIVIIKKNLAQGKIYLLSAHPEGNLHNQISANDLRSTNFFLNLLN